MSIVRKPQTLTNSSGKLPAVATVQAMELGQHLIAIVLTAIGVIRAVSTGVNVPVAIICGLAILAGYAVGMFPPSRTRSHRFEVLWLLSLAVIWIAVVAISAEFIWLAFLLWLLAGHVLTIRWGIVFSILVLGVVIAAPIMHNGSTSYANIFGPLVGGIFAFGISRGYLQLLRDAAERERLVASLTSAQQEMAELQDELAHAQRHSGATAERARISRDIHDTIAQALSSIRLLAHAGADRTEDPDAARTLSQAETLASESLTDVRRIVAALAPAELEDDALAGALQRMLDRIQDETGIATQLHVDSSLPILPTEVEVALLRSAQSALANVRLHSQATSVIVSLIDAADFVRLDIIDTGVGFDLDSWELTTDAAASSYGLRFMSARLRELGGGIDVESTVGEGTAISAYLPIHMSPSENTAANQEPEEQP